MSIEQTTINPKPDWSIEELYRKAWDIVKKNKVLWIFAAAMGSTLNFGNNFNLGNNDFDGLQKFFENKSTTQPESLSYVLGNSTDIFKDQALGIISYAISAIPFWIYLILALELVALVIIGFIISSVYQAYAQGALLENTQICINGGKANIREASEKAFSYLKSLIYLQIVPGLMIALAFMTGFAISVIGIIILSTGFKIIFGFIIFALIIGAIIASITLALLLIWAPRIVVFEKKSAPDAIRMALSIIRKKFWATLLLGLVNNFVTTLIFILPFITLFALIFAMIFAGMKIEELRPLLFLIGGFLIMALLLITTVLGAILNSFKAVVWSLAYTNIRGKYEK